MMVGFSLFAALLMLGAPRGFWGLLPREPPPLASPTQLLQPLTPSLVPAFAPPLAPPHPADNAAAPHAPFDPTGLALPLPPSSLPPDLAALADGKPSLVFLMERGLAALGADRAEVAADAFESAIRLLPPPRAMAFCLYWAGVAHVRAGRPAKARVALAKVRITDPEAPWLADAEALKGSLPTGALMDHHGSGALLGAPSGLPGSSLLPGDGGVPGSPGTEASPDATAPGSPGAEASPSTTSP